MKATPGFLFAAAALAASIQPLEAQTTDVFFQEAELAPVRPLTADEKANLHDRVFRLVLAGHADVSSLSDIEALIQPDRGMRRIFVVDELIKDPRQPQDRRSVIMFDGNNGDTQLPGNIALSLRSLRTRCPTRMSRSRPGGGTSRTPSTISTGSTATGTRPRR